MWLEVEARRVRRRRRTGTRSSSEAVKSVSFFLSSLHSVVVLTIPHAPQGPSPAPPSSRFLSFPSRPRVGKLAGRSRQACSDPPAGLALGRPLCLVGVDKTVLESVESCGGSLIFRQSAFPSPLPHSRSRLGALLPLPGSVGDSGLPRGRCILPHPSGARGLQPRGGGGRSVTWTPSGGGAARAPGCSALEPPRRGLCFSLRIR